MAAVTAVYLYPAAAPTSITGQNQNTVVVTLLPATTADTALITTAFGLTTAANYAFSGLVDWPLAFVFIAGGVVGGLIGTRIAKRLGTGGTLTTVFAVLIFVVAAYMLWKSAAAFL